MITETATDLCREIVDLDADEDGTYAVYCDEPAEPAPDPRCARHLEQGE